MRRKIKKIAIFSILILMTPRTWSAASVELFGYFPVGYTAFSEISAGSNYDNNGAFPFGHTGLGVGSKVLWNLGNFSLGFMGDIAWTGDSIERTNKSGLNETSTYRFETNRIIYGPCVDINFSHYFSMVGEYYPLSTSKVIYSDEKAQNPWRKNDNIKSKGFGAGFSYSSGSFKTTILYREISMSSSDLNSVNTDFPSASYQVPKTTEILIRGGVVF